MRKIFTVLPVLIVLILVAAPLVTHAAGKKVKGEIVMKMGSKVHLFHSGNVAAQKEIAVGDILPVYRATVKPLQVKEVGQVKVTGFIGEHYFEAEIIKGEVKIGDIVQKEKTALLVQPAK